MDAFIPRELIDCFNDLPRANDEIFRELWDKNKLTFQGKANVDFYEKLSSQLACAAIDQDQYLFLHLPLNGLKSSALLFSSVLLMKTVDKIDKGIKGGQVLYLGSYIGIRDLLGQVYVRGECLEDFFRKINLTQSGDPTKKSKSGENINSTPSIFYSYSPVDVKGVIEFCNPEWIFIDCFNEVRIKWLDEALSVIRQNSIPTIGIFNNSLSHVTKVFDSHNFLYYRWPSSSENTTNKKAVNIKPIIVKGGQVEEVSGKLKNAYRTLSKISSEGRDLRLANDAISIAWQFLWNIEGLTVPVEYYNEESNNFYYAKSFEYLKEGLKRFIESIKYVDETFKNSLQQVFEDLAEVVDIFEESSPPFWSLVTNLCVSEVPTDIQRLIVFGNSLQRQIFTISLLANYNISEEELADLKVYLTDVKEIQKVYSSEYTSKSISEHIESLNFIKNECNLEINIIGCPTKYTFGYLNEAIKAQDTINTYIYPYQIAKLKRVIRQNNSLRSIDKSKNSSVFSSLRVNCQESNFDLFQNNLFGISTINEVEIETSKTKETDKTIEIDVGNYEDEVEWLLEDGDQEDFSTSTNVRVNGSEEESSKSIFVEQAIELEFRENKKAIFETNQQLNVISYSKEEIKINEKYVRAIKEGDKILFIDGQKRQSLYSLIISRVHRHPAMLIHVALVDKWQDELAVAYRHWTKKKRRRGYKQLLEKLKSHGSSIQTSVTIQNWLSGRTLCPDDKEDLDRLANILDLSFLKKNSQRVYKSAKRLRIKHRSWGRKVNQWIKKSIFGSHGYQDVKLDEELNLSISDFRDSLLILNVERKSVKEGLFLTDNLGKLEKIK